MSLSPAASAAVQQTRDWLLDLVRLGLRREELTRPAHWFEQSARLVDAKCPGLARRIRRISQWPPGDPAWPALVLAELGRLHLFLRAADQYNQLPPALGEEVRLYLTPPPRREKLLESGLPQVDRWLVLGRRVRWEPLGEQQRMRVAETWLLGEASAQTGLHLAFSPERHGRPVPGGPEPARPLGPVLAASPGGTRACFVSHALPQRLLFAETPLFAPADPPGIVPGPTFLPDFTAADAALQDALEQLPWLEQLPLLLDQVRPLTDEQARSAGCLDAQLPFPARRWVVDRQGAAYPISPLFPEAAWHRWLSHAQNRTPGRVFAIMDPPPYLTPLTLWGAGEDAPREFF